MYQCTRVAFEWDTWLPNCHLCKALPPVSRVLAYEALSKGRHDTENDHSEPHNLANGKIRDGAGMVMVSMGRVGDIGVFPMEIDMEMSKEKK